MLRNSARLAKLKGYAQLGFDAGRFVMTVVNNKNLNGYCQAGWAEVYLLWRRL